MAQNKADSIKGIVDEKEKLDLLKQLETTSDSIFYSVAAIRSYSGIISRGLDDKGSNSVQASIEKWASTLRDTMLSLTGLLTDLTSSIETSASKQDAQLSEALSSDNAGAFVGDGGSAVASASEQPMLVAAIGGLETAIVEGFAGNTAAIHETSANQTQAQAEQTKLFVANEEKNDQANERNRLLNPDKNKPVPDNDKNKPKKFEMPKFPLDGKQFMGGLGKILKGILNPVAMIAGVFFHLLPYIILAVAFFKGFWKGLSPKFQKRVIKVAKKIAFYAGLAFLLFKGLAILIKTLAFAWHMIKIGYAVAKWALEIAFNVFRTGLSTAEHSTKMFFLVFKRICALIEHVAQMFSIALENALNIAAFVLKVAAIAMIVLMIVLLVGGIILLFVLFGDKIVEAVGKIIEVFAMLGGLIYDAIIGFIKLIVDSIVEIIVGLIGGLIMGFIKAFTGGSSDDGSKSKKSEDSKLKPVTEDAFTAAIKPIASTLDTIKECVRLITGFQLMQRLGGATMPMPQSMPAQAMTQMEGDINNVANTKNGDSVTSNVESSYVSNQSKASDAEKKLHDDLAAILKFLQEWYKSTDKSRFVHPNQLI